MPCRDRKNRTCASGFRAVMRRSCGTNGLIDGHPHGVGQPACSVEYSTCAARPRRHLAPADQLGRLRARVRAGRYCRLAQKL